jgi:hypothetical protein
MDHGACNVIYLDRRAREELVRKEFPAARLETHSASDKDSSYFRQEITGQDEVNINLHSLFSTFTQGKSGCCSVLAVAPPAFYAGDDIPSQHANSPPLDSDRVPIRRKMPVEAV